MTEQSPENQLEPLPEEMQIMRAMAIAAGELLLQNLGQLA